MLEKMATEGILMTRFHTASACSPTRSMLFSGIDNHRTGLGQMAEHMRAFGDYFKGRPGYKGYFIWRVAALSGILEEAGYDTIMAGKWHLGLTRELAPCSRGFQQTLVSRQVRATTMHTNLNLMTMVFGFLFFVPKATG